MDSKYNEFIENYLINDKTKSAIMLIGGWGTGKSYYIQNVLKPYLNDKRAKSCITVSLYGLNELKEISKSIYLEIKTRHSAKVWILRLSHYRRNRNGEKRKSQALL